ncbi:unnamed protein product [Polarella glacialis]|uniref:Uncharacterized protein n=2 Tax=Polarella glacialis TaxID=89957 RepID=A0A813FQ85_POLGL|nr:unnamed protein product [Polarella glacialis]
MPCLRSCRGSCRRHSGAVKEVVFIFTLVLVCLALASRSSSAAEIEPLLRTLFTSLPCHTGLAAPTERALVETHRFSRSLAPDPTDTGSFCYLELMPGATERFDLHPAENALLGLIYLQLAERNVSIMREILKGAHILVEEDSRKLIYKLLSSLPGAHARISSHMSDKKQYGIPEGRVLSTLLVGSLANSTWFQLEGHPWDPFRDPVGSTGHILDYIHYKLSGKNQGPLGASPFTDQHPMVFERPVTVLAEVCPAYCRQPPRTGARFATLSSLRRLGRFLLPEGKR